MQQAILTQNTTKMKKIFRQLLTNQEFSDIIFNVGNKASPAEVVEWQTRYFEVVVSVWLMWVQVPSSAPEKSKSIDLDFFVSYIEF